MYKRQVYGGLSVVGECFGETPRLEIYGTEGALICPDPNTYGGPVLLLSLIHILDAQTYPTTGKHEDMVRFELMARFGYYITESSEHNAEYTPYFIKSQYPELIDRFNIPLNL